MGRTCASLVVGGVFVAAGAFGAAVNPVNVTLPHAVSVGSVTLPAGQYVISNFEMGGEDFFVVRGEKTPAVTLRGVRVESDADNTAVTFSKDGDTWHFNRLTVAGEGEAFQLMGGK